MVAEMPLDNRTVNKFAAFAATSGLSHPFGISPRIERFNISS
jgi:hypothetical protein